MGHVGGEERPPAPVGAGGWLQRRPAVVGMSWVEVGVAGSSFLICKFHFPLFIYLF
jgi:hypothetical protein